MTHELVISNGHVIDPANTINGITDIAFSGGRVAAVGDELASSGAETVIDAGGKYVVPGLIDLHTHVYWGGTSLGVDAEGVGRVSGTTTFVDAGSSGPGNFPGFKAHVIDPCPLRILAFVNISFAGIFAFSRNVMVGECRDMDLLHPGEVVDIAREYPELIRGIKVRVGRIAGGTSGVAPLDLAVEVAEELDLPIMAHIDYPPPGRSEVLTRLRPGDVLTHCFRPFPNAPITRTGAMREDMIAARERGIIFDIGHGAGSFAFHVGTAALAEDFPPDCISSDVHQLCIDGPTYHLLETMSKFRNLGMSMFDVVACATATPARALRMPDLGHLGVGAIGDAVILEEEEGAFVYHDITQAELKGNTKLATRQIVVAGELWHTVGG